MLRYCALFWNPLDTAASAMAHRWASQCHTWQGAVDEDGMIVLVSGLTASQSPRILRDKQERCVGVVVGDFFTASPIARCSQLSADESERILRSGGRALTTDYWGNYVALLRDPQTAARWVLRGPASTLPCLHTSSSGVDLYFSWTEAVAAFDGISFSVDWKFVARSLMAPLASTHTGIREIREIPAGFCDVHVNGATVLRRCWDAIAIARGEAIEDFERAAEKVHDVTLSCTHAWAEGISRVLHALSGGLDSSILLGCLNTSPGKPDIVCVTHFGEGPDSDERYFARLAAERSARELIECLQPTDIDLHGVLHGVRFESSPGMRIPDIDRIEPDIARERGAEIITKGHGGDELFCRHHTYLYLADFLRDHLLHPSLLPYLLHVALTEGETVWTVLTRAIRDAFVPRRWDMYEIFKHDQEDQSLLRPEVTAEILKNRTFDLPGEQSTRNCPPGKLWQINLLAGRRFHYLPSTREDDARQVSPLLSQPLIEACLRIPTYLQMKDRRERAVAKAAFVREVPQEILQRRWKGGAEHLAWRLFRRNIDFIRELLLEGELTTAGLVDRPRLETLLSGDPSGAVRATVPIFDLLGVEAWLQAWSLRTRH